MTDKEIYIKSFIDTIADELKIIFDLDENAVEILKSERKVIFLNNFAYNNVAYEFNNADDLIGAIKTAARESAFKAINKIKSRLGTE